MTPYDRCPEKWPRPRSQDILEATESVGGSFGHGSYEAHRWLIVGAISRRLAADRVLENRYRPAELPARLTMLDAVVTHCVWSSGVNGS